MVRSCGDSPLSADQRSPPYGDHRCAGSVGLARRPRTPRMRALRGPPRVQPIEPVAAQAQDHINRFAGYAE